MPKKSKDELTIGQLGKMLSPATVKEIQELWAKLPKGDADVETHQEHVGEIASLKRDMGKIMKHINRHYVVANTQLLKAKMKAHAKQQLSIFEFGTDPVEENKE